MFVLPWEVHLVDFNRELCNLIYRSEQEQDDLESAFRKAVFSPEKKEEYLPVLQERGFMEIPVLRWCSVMCRLPERPILPAFITAFKAVPADSYKTESDTCSLSSRQVSDSCDGGIPKRDVDQVLDAMKTVYV